METKIKTANIVKRPSLRYTLLALPCGEPRFVSGKDFSIQAIKNAVSILRKEGYSFDISIKKEFGNQVLITKN